MKKTLGLLAVLTIAAGISGPASANPPGGPCSGQVDVSCNYNDPAAGQRTCDYWLNDGSVYKKYCGELPNVGPIV